MTRHEGCDPSGTHEVAVPLPSCGHRAATGHARCPVCGAPAALGMALAYNEHPLTHLRLQREHDAAQRVEARRMLR